MRLEQAAGQWPASQSGSERRLLRGLRDVALTLPQQEGVVTMASDTTIRDARRLGDAFVSRGTRWGTSCSKRPLYPVKSETWTRPVIPTLAFHGM
jgi:hypothetical protein